MRRKDTWTILTAVLLFITVDATAQITKQEARSAFVSAGLAYKDGRYDEAVAKYEQIIDGGLETGPVYYNLGNSYFRQGELGRAVLNYERARRLIPRDSDLNFNEHYAYTLVEHHGDVRDVPLTRRVVDGFIGWYTVDEMALIIVALLTLLGAAVLLGLYLNWPRSVVRPVAVLLTALAVLYAWGLNEKIRAQQGRAVIVTAAESYFEPREDSTVHFKLSEGAKVKVVGEEFGWLKIKRLDAKAGWIPEEVLERI